MLIKRQAHGTVYTTVWVAAHVSREVSINSAWTIMSMVVTRLAHFIGALANLVTHGTGQLRYLCLLLILQSPQHSGIKTKILVPAANFAVTPTQWNK